MNDLNVVLAGGGTAGHVNPLLATAHALAERGATVTAVGTKEGLEATLVPADGFPLEYVERAPFPRRPNLAAVRFPLAFRKAVAQAGAILDRTGAEVAVGFGGFASTPIYVAAMKRGVPVVIHEANAKPGLANKLGARSAAAVALTFASTPLSAPNGITQTVGLPLRPPIARLAAMDAGERAAERVAAAARLGLDPSLPTLLVTGGSLGAQHINEVLEQAMEPVADSGIQILHLTGKGKDATVREALERAGGNSRYTVLDYLATMEDGYAAADLVLCRSGAGTVAELGALGLPGFFVPLPIGNGEQELNAADVIAAGGARLVRNDAFTTNVLINEVLPLAADREALASMAEAARETSPANAAAKLADMVVSLAGGAR